MHSRILTQHLGQNKPGMNAITRVTTVITGITSALKHKVLAEVTITDTGTGTATAMVTTVATTDKVNIRAKCTWVTYLRGHIISS